MARGTGEVSKEIAVYNMFEIGVVAKVGLKPSLLLASSRGLLSLTGFLVSFKRTSPNLALICHVTLDEFLSLSGPWSSLYKMKRKN